MKVVFYTQPHYLDTALPLIQALSRHVELHVLLELPPDGWRSCILDQERRTFDTGLIDATAVFEGPAWEKTRLFWTNAASFHVVMHNCARSIHPSTWYTSQLAARRVIQLQPDIFHIDDVSLRAAWTAIGARSVPQVLTINDVLQHEGERNWRNALASSIMRKAATRYIVHSDHQRRLFCDGDASRSEQAFAIELGILDIYRNWAKVQPNKHEPTILFFGRLSQYKGLELLFEAAKSVAARIPNLRIVVAGRPVPGYELPSLPKSLPGNARIDVIDRYIPNLELANLFSRAKVVVCPYTSATQSGVVLTAYAFGKAVVVTDVGGLPEYVRDGKTGYVVPAGDVGALATRLVDALLHDNDALLSHEIDYLRNDKLSWDRIARKTVSVYKEVVSAAR